MLDRGATAPCVAIIDDHRLLTSALAVALRDEHCEVIIPSLETLQALLGALFEVRPTVVLLDRGLGAFGSGEALIAPLSEASVAVVVISAALDDVTIGRCFAGGAVACISKTEPLDAVLATVLRLANGERLVSEAERGRFVETWRRWEVGAESASAPFTALTLREASVLGQLMEGHSVRSIAAQSYVSEGTVRTQVRSIFTKLGVGKQLEAVTLAVRIGWKPPMTPPASPQS